MLWFFSRFGDDIPCVGRDWIVWAISSRLFTPSNRILWSCAWYSFWRHGRKRRDLWLRIIHGTRLGSDLKRGFTRAWFAGKGSRRQMLQLQRRMHMRSRLRSATFLRRYLSSSGMPLSRGVLSYGWNANYTVSAAVTSTATAPAAVSTSSSTTSSFATTFSTAIDPDAGTTSFAAAVTRNLRPDRYEIFQARGWWSCCKHIRCLPIHRLRFFIWQGW